jgi:hypothetical protein
VQANLPSAILELQESNQLIADGAIERICIGSQQRRPHDDRELAGLHPVRDKHTAPADAFDQPARLQRFVRALDRQLADG